MNRRKTVRAVVMLLTMFLTLCSLGGRKSMLAFAEQGSITVSQRSNSGATYDAYLVFLADIDEHDQASNVAWPSDETKQAVLSFLDENGYQSWLDGKRDAMDQHDLAQNAAEYVTAMISGSETDLGAATTPRSTAGRSFANTLARYLAGQGIEPDGTVSDGKPFEGEQGLWLLVTTGSTIDSEGEAGTGPIWVPIGGSISQILEKSDIPALNMEVREDSKETWGTVADSNIEQSLSYRLTGTLPENLDSFPTYHYRFEVSFPDGIELDIGPESDLSKSLQVRIGDQNATLDGNELSASYENGHLFVDFADLKSSHWDGFDIDKDTVITVTYTAHLDHEAVVGIPGNTCTAKLSYSGDPVNDSDTYSEAIATTVFTYQMSLVKVDKQTKDKLGGAVFSIQVAQDNSDEQSRGLYVQGDGSLGTIIHSFTTNDSGTLLIAGLDEGTYLINEVSAPNGYKATGDVIKLSVESNLSDVDRSLKAFRATSSSKTSTQIVVLSDKGMLTLTVENERQSHGEPNRPNEALAQTGVGPIAGILVLTGIFVALVSSTRKPRQ